MPAPRRDWYAITNRADQTEVLLFGEIDSWFGVSAEKFSAELAALDVDRLTVRINSPGGSAFDGVAIFNALARHRARVITVVEGLAASAASFIAQAGDERRISKYGEMMIHDAAGVCIGDAADMAAMSATLDQLSDNIAHIYADRAGGDVAVWRERMAAETWYSATDAVAAGLADAVDEPLAQTGAQARAYAVQLAAARRRRRNNHTTIGV